MKNIFKSLMLVAVAAMAFTACEKGNEGADSTPEAKVTVKFSADFAETRTSFGDKTGAGYPSTWSGTETVAFSLNEANFVSSEVTMAGATANFDVELTDDGTTEGAIYAFSPMGNAAGFKTIYNTYHDVVVTIPTVQTPKANSCDESAHLIAAKLEYTDGIPSSGHLQFAPVAAFGKMTITGFAGTIKSVALTASKEIAGSAYFYYNHNGETEETMIPNGGSKTIALNATNVENNVFWFGCIPADLTDGSLTVVITDSEDNTYTKTINPTSEKRLAFAIGRVSNFSVDFTGITANTVEWVNNAYNLVRDTANLEVGDKVVIAAAGYNKAIGKQGNNNFAATGITKNSNNNTIDFDSNVTILTVVEGNTAGTFAFMLDEKYLYAASSSSNHLKTQTTNDVNSSFTVTIADGVATVKAEMSSNRNWMRYNLDSDLFSCYSSGQKDICIYKLVGEYTPRVPAISYIISDVNLSYDATSGEATVTATNAEGWNIEATTEADWVSALAYANGKITFTTEVNDTAEARTATVNVTATKEGYDNVTTTFKIKQNTQPTGGGELGDPYSYTFEAKTFTANGTKTLGTLGWTLAGDGGYWGIDNTKGQQFGSGTKPYTQLTLSTSDYEGGVETIKLNTSGANSINATCTVTVGGTQIGDTITLTNSATEYTFTSDTALTGDIVISYTQTSSKAMYIKSISINPAN